MNPPGMELVSSNKHVLPASAEPHEDQIGKLPVQLSRAVALPKLGQQPQTVALPAWQSLATVALRLLSACISFSSQVRLLQIGCGSLHHPSRS